MIHEMDLREGFREVYLPFALDRKYPGAAREWRWQYVFPAGKRSVDPRSGKERRHHLDSSPVNKAIAKAVRQEGECFSREGRAWRVPWTIWRMRP